MVITHFNHCHYYVNNQFDHSYLSISTAEKRYEFKGVKQYKYIAPNGEEVTAPRQVLMQLGFAMQNADPISMHTEEPTMFNLETYLDYEHYGARHRIIIEHHVLHEKTDKYRDDD